MVTAEIIGFSKVLSFMESLKAGVRTTIKQEMERQAVNLQNTVKDGYLSGQALGVRSGHLKRSIAKQVTEDYGHFEGLVGTNLAYGRFWELGFHGVEHVRGFTRVMRFATHKSGSRLMTQSDLIYGPSRKSAYSMLVFAKRGDKKASEMKGTVRPFDRTVNQDARPFLSPALAQLAPSIRAALEAALQRALKS